MKSTKSTAVPAWRILVAALLPLISAGAQWDFRVWFDAFPFVGFYPAVYFAALIGGLWGGLGATALSTFLVFYFFLEPHRSFALDHPMNLLALAVFGSVGTVFALTTHRLRVTESALFEELSRTESLLERASSIAHVGGWEFDAQTMDGSWTDEVARIHDLEPSEYATVSQGVSFFTDASSIAIEGAIQRAISEAVPYDLELELISAKGVHKWVRTVGKPVLSHGKVTHVRGIMQDITESKCARDEVGRVQRRLTLALDAANIGIWEFDFGSGAYVWDERMWRLNGLSPDDFASPAEARASVTSPEEVTRMERLFVDAVERHTDFVDDAEIAWPDGSVHVLRSHSLLQFDDDGHPLAATGVTYDVTEEREMNRVLEHRVELRTAEVTAANHELEAFAYAVSHDLRAPLRAMSGFCRALEEDYGAQLDETAHTYMDHIIQASHNMGDLIDGILLLSRSTRGEIEREPIDISAMSEKLIDAQRDAHPERTFASEIAQGLTCVGDPRMIEVVLQNLINNAAKYSSKTEGARIEVSSEEREGKTWICVTDNGAGFDPRYIESLFEPFRRLHRQDEFPGIGIGLATVQRIVNRHGGQIRAEGEPDRGAKFCFWLPEGA